MPRYRRDKARAYEAGEELLIRLRDELDHIDRTRHLTERIATFAGEVVRELRLIRQETVDERHLAAVLLADGHDWPHGEHQFLLAAQGAVTQLLDEHRRKSEAGAVTPAPTTEFAEGA